jgi:hypothetical protein
MSVLELFNIYHPTAYCHGMVAFHVRQNPIFIWLRGNYSNNEYWSKGFLYISGEWESSTTETLDVDQRNMTISILLVLFFCVRVVNSLLSYLV